MMNTMPVLVEVPVNHEAVTDLPESLLERINFKKTSDEVAADSERMSARSEVLREAHLASVRDRAARETQRGEEAAARKRRMAAEDLRRLESKIEAAAAKSEARKREQMEKREQEKTKRLAAAEAVQEARQQAHVSTIKKGLEKASRACAAVTAREKKVAEVVKRTGAQVKHALSVAASMKEKKTDRSMGEETDRCDGQIQPLDSPHPAVIDSERLASPHPAHAQLQKDLEQQLHLHNPLQKLMSTNLNASSASGGAKDSTSTSSKTSTPRRSMTPRQPMMTIVEDKELSTDHRSQAFERCWFKEQTASGRFVWSYIIRWDDGSYRTVRGLA